MIRGPLCGRSDKFCMECVVVSMASNVKMLEQGIPISCAEVGELIGIVQMSLGGGADRFDTGNVMFPMVMSNVEM